MTVHFCVPWHWLILMFFFCLFTNKTIQNKTFINFLCLLTTGCLQKKVRRQTKQTKSVTHTNWQAKKITKTWNFFPNVSNTTKNQIYYFFQSKWEMNAKSRHTLFPWHPKTHKNTKQNVQYSTQKKNVQKNNGVIDLFLLQFVQRKMTQLEFSKNKFFLFFVFIQIIFCGL